MIAAPCFLKSLSQVPLCVCVCVYCEQFYVLIIAVSHQTELHKAEILVF